MQIKEKEVSNNSTDLLGVLLIVFIVLKLTHTIDWSWWWVLSPLLVEVALLIIVGIIIGIMEIMDR